MISHFKLLTLFLLFGLIASQPPKPNGRDREFLTPLNSLGSFPPRIEDDTSGDTDNPISEPDLVGDTVDDTETPIQCRRVRFRFNDGRCTHRIDGDLARARRAHFSYFDADTRDFPETGLKSPRVISNMVSSQAGDIFNDRSLNELLVFFGQFLDHNVVATPLSDEEEDIEAPEGSKEKLPFRRSMRAPTGEGDGERPINILPTAIDLVAVYGPNDLRNEALRLPNSCKLKTSTGNLLPFNTDGFSNAPTTGPEFYFAGDQRSNEHPVLTSIHTLWVREHNYLCDVIAEKFPMFNAVKLYETARSINIAEFQKVVFKEFFPAITGRFLPRYRGFRSRADPTLSSLFSTAAFRVGHTMIGNMLTKIGSEGTVTQTPLSENFFLVESVRDGIEPFLRGAAETKAQEIDVKVVDSLRNFLFEGVPNEEGPDLIALNLQRGRDHRIPSFNDVRKEFRLRPLRSFADLTDDLEVQGRLAAAYDSIDDVEAWIGMMAERKMRKSSFGPTLFAVWFAEFLRLRNGDQFYFENRKALPRMIRRFCPELVRPLERPRSNLFRDILLRNTNIPPESLNVRAAFKVAV